MSLLFGIHIGNTSACLASYKDGKVHVITNDNGDRITPSLVSVNEEATVVGISAKTDILRNITSTVMYNKMMLNKDLDDSTLIKIGNKIPYKISKDETGIKYTLKQAEWTFVVTPEFIAISIFKKLFEIACSAVRCDGKLKTVLCCPVNFPQSSRCTLMHAAEEAGFDVLQVISEPAAAAFAYSVGIVQKPEDESACLVYRVGGATLDACLVSERSGMHCIVHGAHLDIGGDMFTAVLADYLAEKYKNKCKLDPLENVLSMAKLTAAAESCKHALSFKNRAHCFVESLCEGIDFSYSITRKKFEILIVPTVRQFVDPIKQILSKMENISVEKVVLSGGGTKVPKLQQVIRDIFPYAECINTLSADEVIAIGAAKRAGLLSKHAEPAYEHLPHEIPVTSTSIFVRARGMGRKCVIPEKTRIPVTKGKILTLMPTKNDTNIELLEVKKGKNKLTRTLAKISLGPIMNPVELFLKVNINSIGALSVGFTVNSDEELTTVKLDPPEE